MNRQRLAPRALMRIASAATALALAGTLVAFAAPAPLVDYADAAVWTVDTNTRTDENVRWVWNTLKPSYTGGVYAVSPSLTAPYAPGDAAAGSERTASTRSTSRATSRGCPTT